MNNPHYNARTPFHNRSQIVEGVLKEAKSVKEVAEGLDVNRSTVYKWMARYRQVWEKALYNWSSRPKCSSQRMSVERVTTISALRRRRMSCLEIAFRHSLSVYNITLELKSLGLNKLSRMEFKRPAIPYWHKALGDIIHLGIKELGRMMEWIVAFMETISNGKMVLVGSMYMYALTTKAAWHTTRYCLVRRLSAPPAF